MELNIQKFFIIQKKLFLSHLIKKIYLYQEIYKKNDLINNLAVWIIKNYKAQCSIHINFFNGHNIYIFIIKKIFPNDINDKCL